MKNLKEETITGDVAPVEKPLRQPDSKGPYGHPSFKMENVQFSKIVNPKKKWGRWDEVLEDEEIKTWARKNPTKAFYIECEGIHFRMR